MTDLPSASSHATKAASPIKRKMTLPPIDGPVCSDKEKKGDSRHSGGANNAVQFGLVKPVEIPSRKHSSMFDRILDDPAPDRRMAVGAKAIGTTAKVKTTLAATNAATANNLAVDASSVSGWQSLGSTSLGSPSEVALATTVEKEKRQQQFPSPSNSNKIACSNKNGDSMPVHFNSPTKKVHNNNSRSNFAGSAATLSPQQSSVTPVNPSHVGGIGGFLLTPRRSTMLISQGKSNQPMLIDAMITNYLNTFLPGSLNFTSLAATITSSSHIPPNLIAALSATASHNIRAEKDKHLVRTVQQLCSQLRLTEFFNAAICALSTTSPLTIFPFFTQVAQACTVTSWLASNSQQHNKWLSSKEVGAITALHNYNQHAAFWSAVKDILVNVRSAVLLTLRRLQNRDRVVDYIKHAVDEIERNRQREQQPYNAKSFDDALATLRMCSSSVVDGVGSWNSALNPLQPLEATINVYLQNISAPFRSNLPSRFSTDTAVDLLQHVEAEDAATLQRLSSLFELSVTESNAVVGSSANYNAALGTTNGSQQQSQQQQQLETLAHDYRASLSKLVGSTAKIQNMIRNFLKRRRQEFDRLVNGAAIKIQCAYRKYVSRKVLYERRHLFVLVTKVQAVVRGSMQRKRTRRLIQCLKAAIVIQRNYKRGLSRNRLTNMLVIHRVRDAAIKKIVRFFRTTVHRVKNDERRQEELRRNGAALRLTRWARRLLYKLGFRPSDQSPSHLGLGQSLRGGDGLFPSQQSIHNTINNSSSRIVEKLLRENGKNDSSIDGADAKGHHAPAVEQEASLPTFTIDGVGVLHLTAIGRTLLYPASQTPAAAVTEGGGRPMPKQDPLSDHNAAIPESPILALEDSNNNTTNNNSTTNDSNEAYKHKTLMTLTVSVDHDEVDVGVSGGGAASTAVAERCAVAVSPSTPPSQALLPSTPPPTCLQLTSAGEALDVFPHTEACDGRNVIEIPQSVRETEDLSWLPQETIETIVKLQMLRGVPLEKIANKIVLLPTTPSHSSFPTVTTVNAGPEEHKLGRECITLIATPTGVFLPDFMSYKAAGPSQQAQHNQGIVCGTAPGTPDEVQHNHHHQRNPEALLEYANSPLTMSQEECHNSCGVYSRGTSPPRNRLATKSPSASGTPNCVPPSSINLSHSAAENSVSAFFSPYPIPLAVQYSRVLPNGHMDNDVQPVYSITSDCLFENVDSKASISQRGNSLESEFNDNVKCQQMSTSSLVHRGRVFWAGDNFHAIKIQCLFRRHLASKKKAVFQYQRAQLNLQKEGEELRIYHAVHLQCFVRFWQSTVARAHRFKTIYEHAALIIQRNFRRVLRRWRSRDRRVELHPGSTDPLDMSHAWLVAHCGRPKRFSFFDIIFCIVFLLRCQGRFRQRRKQVYFAVSRIRTAKKFVSNLKARVAERRAAITAERARAEAMEKEEHPGSMRAVAASCIQSFWRASSHRRKRLGKEVQIKEHASKH